MKRREQVADVLTRRHLLNEKPEGVRSCSRCEPQHKESGTDDMGYQYCRMQAIQIKTLRVF